MTSTPVKQAGALMNLVGAGAAAAAGNMATRTGSFGDVMNKASGEANSQSDRIKPDTEKSKDLSPVQTDKPQTHKDSPKAEEVKKPEKTTEVTGKQEEAVEEAGKELVEKVAEELGVSEEEVVRAMEQLGLSMASLLDAENLTRLVLTLSGTADSLALLTDENLYASMKDLLQSLSEIKAGLGDELALSQEELAQLLETMEAEAKIPKEGLNQSDPLLSGNAIPTDTEGEMRSAKITITVEQNGESIQLSADEKGNTERVETVVSEESVQTPEKTAGKQGSESKDSKQGEGNSQMGNPLLDALLQNKVQAQPVSFEQTAGLFSQDTQEIMNQILDYMKIQLKPGMDQLEMQLHPASLGSVHIQIASKGGEITAQFHVQNESVKAAIESQIVELRDSLREQGIKVEAVEVTVESHAFEQNLWQGQGNEEHAGGQGQKRSTRRINLNELDGLPGEEAGEEEKLAAKMMEANGNTVDYTA